MNISKIKEIKETVNIQLIMHINSQSKSAKFHIKYKYTNNKLNTSKNQSIKQNGLANLFTIHLSLQTCYSSQVLVFYLASRTEHRYSSLHHVQKTDREDQFASCI